MSESPVDQFLDAIDTHDVEAAMRFFAPDCRLLTVDGRRVEGADVIRELFTDFLAMLRSVTHGITAQWQQDDVWIAEVDVSYELQDRSKIRRPRAFVVRTGPEGFVEMHVYGAHERPLAERSTGDEGMQIGGRWIPPL